MQAFVRDVRRVRQRRRRWGDIVVQHVAGWYTEPRLGNRRVVLIERHGGDRFVVFAQLGE